MNPLALIRSTILILMLSFAWLTTAPISASAAHTMTPEGRGLTVIPKEILPSATLRGATLVARRPAEATMSVTVGLPIRNGERLNRFISHEEAGRAQPLTQSEFDERYGQPQPEVNRVTGWLRSKHLKIGYRSPDGLTIAADGTTGDIERAFRTSVNEYLRGNRRFFAPTRNPSVPSNLHIQTILGLENYYHATYDMHSQAVRQGGFIPADFRAAYGVAGHGFYGQGQSLGFTLWGVPVSNSDFGKFAQLSGDPRIYSCLSCSYANRIQWIAVNAKSTDKSALGETALDVEYGQGMAPLSHLRYYLAQSSNDGALADTIAAAANDPTLHVVSNSWGGGFLGKSNGFTTVTTNEFKHAVAVGTTFYFSSGDDSVYSTCPKASSGPYQVVPCKTVQYPASSPYVVSVGGTNIQMNSNLTKKTLETSWSIANDLSGSGGGCNTGFARPSWQYGVAAATCKGRAEPDIAADGGEDAPADVYVQGQSTPTWGTSLAAPLVAGMAVDTNQYLAAGHEKNKNVPPSMGFAAPKMYRLANSPRYRTYFTDVLCGYNGFPAGPGWDQITGWGSENWAQYSEGFAGVSVGMTAPNTTLCRNLSSSSKLGISFSSCNPALLCWPQPDGNTQAAPVLDNYVDSASKNFFRDLHGSSYASHGFLNAVSQSANVQVGTDSSPVALYLATVAKNKRDAVAIVNDAGKNLAAHNIVPSPCSGSTPDCLVFPEFTFTFSNGTEAAVWYAIFSMQNVVGEAAMLAPVGTLDAEDFFTLRIAGAITADAVTNTPLTSSLSQLLQEEGASMPAHPRHAPLLDTSSNGRNPLSRFSGLSQTRIGEVLGVIGSRITQKQNNITKPQ